MKSQGVMHNKYIMHKYGGSQMLRYILDMPVCPVGYIKTKHPLYKKKSICRYTQDGRKEIHKSLKFNEAAVSALHILAREVITGRSVEYMDNRVSLYAAQYGKCAVTGKLLWIDEIHCHHVKPVSSGGSDEYKNLVIIHKDIHRLIHAVKPETINAYLKNMERNKFQLEKINKFRVKAGNPAI